jgi:hypothetical protein
MNDTKFTIKLIENETLFLCFFMQTSEILFMIQCHYDR